MKIEGTYDITVGGRTRRVHIEQVPNGGAGDGYLVTMDGGRTIKVDATRPVPDVFSLLVDDNSWEAGLVTHDDAWEVEVLGVRHEVAVVDPKRAALRMTDSAGAGVVLTRMPGRIVRLLVGIGDTVKKGTPLLVVEAMKMENEVKAPAPGTVTRFFVEAGDLVETKAALVEIG